MANKELSKTTLCILSADMTNAADLGATQNMATQWVNTQINAGYKVVHEEYTPVLNQHAFILVITIRMELI